MKNLTITMFTDPGCPWAYSAEPTRWRLRWLFGDQLNWKTTLIVLSGYDGETSSMTPEKISHNFASMSEKFGMPMDASLRPHVAQSLPACLALMAVQLNDSEHFDAFLRELRIATMSAELIDDVEVINAAAKRAGIDVGALAEWLKEDRVEAELATGAELARNPTTAALAFRHKLSKTSTDRVRYPAPSYQFAVGDEVQFELPGFWPVEAYEAAIGNLVPTIERRTDPKSVKEVLEWAGTPLATVEVARICAQEVETVRTKLQDVAELTTVGNDGFWSLKH